MVRPCCVAVIGLAVVGCFYDSRWGEAKRAQQRAAARATPTAISTRPAGDDGEARANVTPLRVRVHATSLYAAQTVDWQRQVRDLVEDANRTLAASVGAKLDVVTMQSWSAPPQTDLVATLAALAADDPATDVDLVVGMIGGIPRQTAQFHELGLAMVLGKHAVVRAAHREGEYDDIEKLDELSEEARQRLRRERQHHRALAIFLHEIGHTLGALHERGAASVMFPSYRPTMAGFSADGAALMRIALAHRGDADPRPLARDLIVRIEAAADEWEPRDRDDTLARLRPIAARSDAPPTPPTPLTTPPLEAIDAGTDAAIATLAATDRATYARAHASLSQGRIDEAWTTARPLFAAYPDVLAVQDLRCQLAALRATGASMKTECARMIELMKKDGGAR